MPETTARIAMVTLDVAEVKPSADFWSALLGWDVAASTDDYAMLTGPDGVAHRITTLGPGTTFGEMPVLTGARFLIDVRADTRVQVAVLSAEHFQRLTEQYPLVKLTLLERLATGAYAQMEAAIRTGALQALR